MDRVEVSGNRRLKDAALVVAAVVLFSGCHPTPQGPACRSAVRRRKRPAWAENLPTLPVCPLKKRPFFLDGRTGV